MYLIMEAIWNKIDLEHPPSIRCRVPYENFNTTAFLATLNNIIEDITSQDLLHQEAAILSRLLYLMKTKFRNDKGVKSMSKVNKALRNYLALALEKEYRNLMEYIEREGQFVLLPSKQMVEYVLVKTQGFAKLMLRVEEVCIHAAHFFRCRMALGHSWRVAIIAYATVSRIWILSRYLVKKSCSWYNKLHTYLQSLKMSGLKWLPEGEELPSNLESWISVPWINEPTPRVPSNYAIRNTMFKLIVPRGYDSDDDETVNVRDSLKEANAAIESPLVKEKNIENYLKEDKKQAEIVLEDDTGEVLDRRSFNFQNMQKDCKKIKSKKVIDRIKNNQRNKLLCSTNEINQQKTVRKEKNIMKKLKEPESKTIPKKLQSFHDVKNKLDLILLLNMDSYPGLDKLQWNMIKKKSKKLLNKLETEKTTETIILKKVVKRLKMWIT